ncbi:zinc ribbon domain-containing protein [Streptomyces sp. NPDC005181]|uniref:zinc ribbon domain-containing protein n=1 Tax=Streptomyces sp. NPDC005181 TaxID=3156869 RepID=UPI0033BBCC9E
MELHSVVSFPVRSGPGEVEDQSAPGELQSVAIVEAVKQLVCGHAGGLVQGAVAGGPLQVEAEHGVKSEVLDRTVDAVGCAEGRVEGLGKDDLAACQLSADLGLEALVCADVVERGVALHFDEAAGDDPLSYIEMEESEIAALEGEGITEFSCMAAGFGVKLGVRVKGDDDLVVQDVLVVQVEAGQGQAEHESLLDIEDVTLGYTTTMRWNTQDKWIVSKKLAHTPLIGDETFARAQDVLASRARKGAPHEEHRTRNVCLFRGRIACAACSRRMQGQWSHGEAYYRCRFPEEYALANRVQHPRNVYLREAWIIPPLDAWLAKIFLPHRLDETIDLMAACAPDRTGESSTAAAARAVITACDTKLATHRAALEAGADPALITSWIAETQARRATAEAELRTATNTPTGRMTRDEIARLVRSISDLASVIRQADPVDKAEIYRQVGLRLTFAPGQTTVRVEIHLEPHHQKNDKTPPLQRSRGVMVGVRGGT